MHKLYELKEKLMRELEDYAENGKFSKEDVEAIKYTASAIDHICNIVEGEEEYSMAGQGGNQGGNSYRGSYARGGGNMRRSYRGSYARGRGARRDAMGRYSSEGGYSMGTEDMVIELRDLMEDAPDERTRKEFERFIQKIEGM